MRTGNILFSAVHFFVVFFIISVGLFFLSLPYADTFRLQVTQFIYRKSEVSKLIGGFILGFGLILLIALYLLNRRCFLKIKMGPAVAFIDESIVQAYVQEYWKERHPDEDFHIDVVIQRGEILEIITSVPKNFKWDVEEPLQRLQNELGDRLSRRLGYDREFYLTVLTRPLAIGQRPSSS